MKKLIFILPIALFLSSCLTLSDGNLGQWSSVELNTNNFKYVTTVHGSATASYFLGFGGLNKGLVRTAVDELRKDLKPNQALTNLTIDKGNTFMFGGIIMSKSVYVSADVIEFNR